MGAVLAKFRKEKSTEALLEGLDEKIRQLEKYTLNTQEQKKNFVGNFLVVSIGVYVIAFIVFYFLYFPPTWMERIVHSMPLLLFPVVIILLRMLFTWYFQRKLNKNSNKLTALRAEKKKILEQVMDKETYKVAVKLLHRFGDKTTVNRHSFGMTPRAPSTSNALNLSSRSSTSFAAGNQLNTISVPQQHTASTSLQPTPRQVPMTQRSTASSGGEATSRGAGSSRGVGMPRQLSLSPRPGMGQEMRRRTPFPILNQQDRTVFERIVDVLVGDGPQDRFAMICKECYGHNGMALQEDFDYTAFRCAFCGAMNHSRKSRPMAPQLPIPRGDTPSIKAKNDSSATSSSSSDEGSGTENRAYRRIVPPKTDETTETNAIATGNAAVDSNATTAAAASMSAVEPAAEVDAVHDLGVEDFEPGTPEHSETDDDVENDFANQQASPQKGQEKVNDEFKKEM